MLTVAEIVVVWPAQGGDPLWVDRLTDEPFVTLTELCNDLIDVSTWFGRSKLRRIRVAQISFSDPLWTSQGYDRILDRVAIYSNIVEDTHLDLRGHQLAMFLCRSVSDGLFEIGKNGKIGDPPRSSDRGDWTRAGLISELATGLASKNVVLEKLLKGEAGVRRSATWMFDEDDAD